MEGKLNNEHTPAEIVAGLLTRWADGYTRQDPAAMAALYSDDALFLGSTPALLRPAGVHGYFAALPRMETSVSFEAVEIGELHPGIIQAAMIATFLVPGKSVRMRLTQTYVQRDGAWKIAQHHVSPAS